jgi:hypothetical protein
MNQWYELLEIASPISFSQDEDQLIWQYNSSGVYSSGSLYAIINSGGSSQFIYLLCGSLESLLGSRSSYGCSLRIKS